MSFQFSMLLLNLFQAALFIPVIIFGVFLFDQKQILALQRAGRYDPEMHQTMMSRLFSGVRWLWSLLPRKKVHVRKTHYQDLNINPTIYIDNNGVGRRNITQQ